MSITSIRPNTTDGTAGRVTVPNSATILNSGATGFLAATGAVDLLTGGVIPANVNVIAEDIAGSAAGNTDYVDFYALWYDVDPSGQTNPPRYTAAVANGVPAVSVQLDGTTPQSNIDLLRVRARYLYFVPVNNSGAALNANGGELFIRDMDIDNT